MIKKIIGPIIVILIATLITLGVISAIDNYYEEKCKRVRKQDLITILKEIDKIDSWGTGILHDAFNANTIPCGEGSCEF